MAGLEINKQFFDEAFKKLREEQRQLKNEVEQEQKYSIEYPLLDSEGNTTKDKLTINNASKLEKLGNDIIIKKNSPIRNTNSTLGISEAHRNLVTITENKHNKILRTFSGRGEIINLNLEGNDITSIKIQKYETSEHKYDITITSSDQGLVYAASDRTGKPINITNIDPPLSNECTQLIQLQ